MFGHKKSTDEGLIVIYTIGSARVTGSIVSVTPELSTVLYTKQEQLSYQETVDTEKLERAMLGALMEVSLDIQQNGLREAREKLGYDAVFDSFVCTFASPWFVSQTRLVTLKRKKAFIVKKQLIEALLKDEVNLFQEKIESGEGEYEMFKGSEIVDSYAIRTKLNGYVTKKPYGKSAQSVTLAVYVSLMSTETLNQIREMLHKVFHSDDVHFYSSTLISFLASGQLFKQHQEYLILEVNGEVTDTSIVKDSILLETASFPLGTNSLIRNIKNQSKLSPDDLKSRLKMMQEGKTARDTKTSTKVEDLVYEEVGEWMKNLREALESVTKGTPVPRTAFLMIDPAWELIYKTALKDHSFDLFTFTNHPFTVISVTKETVADCSQFAEGTLFLPSMILAAVTYHKLPK